VSACNRAWEQRYPLPACFCNSPLLPEAFLHARPPGKGALAPGTSLLSLTTAVNPYELFMNL
jgi:hypothetical protein